MSRQDAGFLDTLCSSTESPGGSSKQQGLGLQVPLIYTVYALVSFRQFKRLEELNEPEAQTDEWYQVPDGYTVKTLDEVAEKRRSRRRASWDEGAEGAPNLEAQSSDARILAQMGL